LQKPKKPRLSVYYDERKRNYDERDHQLKETHQVNATRQVLNSCIDKTPMRVHNLLSVSFRWVAARERNLKNYDQESFLCMPV